MLSILIHYKQSNEFLFKRIFNLLNMQIKEFNLHDKVFIITHIIKDWETTSTGEARNILLNKCTTEYLTFINIEDYIHPSYLKLIFQHINNDLHAIGITKLLSYKDGTTQLFFNNKGNPNKRINDNFYAHIEYTSIVKTSIAKKYKFTDTSYQEYLEWEEGINSDIESSISIEEPLYLILNRAITPFVKLQESIIVKYNMWNIENLKNTIKESTRRSLYFIIHVNSDFSLYSALELLNQYDWLFIVNKCDTDKINNINDYIEQFTYDWDYIILLDDNKICKINAWDSIIPNNYVDQYDDYTGALFFNDGHNKSILNTYPILHKNYFKMFNYILNPIYSTFHWALKEFTQVANALTKQTYISDIIFEDINEINLPFISDLKIYKEREKNYFGLDSNLFLVERRPRLKSSKKINIGERILELLNMPNCKFILINNKKDRIIWESTNPIDLIVYKDIIMIGNLNFKYDDLDLIEL